MNSAELYVELKLLCQGIHFEIELLLLWLLLSFQVSHSWSRIKSRGGPPGLFGHSATKVKPYTFFRGYSFCQRVITLVTVNDAGCRVLGSNVYIYFILICLVLLVLKFLQYVFTFLFVHGRSNIVFVLSIDLLALRHSCWNFYPECCWLCCCDFNWVISFEGSALENAWF